MRYLSVNDLHAQGVKSMEPIWVLNTADESLVGQAGEIIITIPQPHGGGDPDLIRVPQSWLPKDLTTIVPRKRLLASSKFLAALNSNLIGIISNEDAARLLRQVGAKEEAARLLAIQKHQRAVGGARTVTDGMKAANGSIGRADGLVDDEGEEQDQSGRNRVGVVNEQTLTVAELAADGVEDEEPGISPSFKMWADRLNVGNDIAARNAVKSKGKFKKVELAFLARTLNKSFTSTHKMVAANLQK